MNKYCNYCKTNSINTEMICEECGKCFDDNNLINSNSFRENNDGIVVLDGNNIKNYEIGMKKYNDNDYLSRHLVNCYKLLKYFPFINHTDENKVKELINDWISRRLLFYFKINVIVTSAVHVIYPEIEIKKLCEYIVVNPMDVVKFLKDDKVDNPNHTLRHPLSEKDYLKNGLLKLTHCSYKLVDELYEEGIKVLNVMEFFNCITGKNPNTCACAVARVLCEINSTTTIYKLTDLLNSFGVSNSAFRNRYHDIMNCFKKLLLHLPWTKINCSENDIIKDVPYILQNYETLIKLHKLKTNNYISNENDVIKPIKHKLNYDIPIPNKKQCFRDIENIENDENIIQEQNKIIKIKKI